MAITWTTGNLFDANAVVLVNPVNCVGVMGAGLAKQFTLRFPELVSAYQQACHIGRLRPGTPLLHPLTNKLVLLFPTKDHWRDPSKLEWIDAGLKRVRRIIDDCKIPSIAFPMIGAGLGGLRWSDVKPLFIQHLGDCDADILVYEGQRQEDSVKKRDFPFSNFQPCTITHNGISYPTVEHFYQAMKTTDVKARQRIASLPTAADAKRAGKTLRVRPDWDALKDRVMWHALKQKFAPGSHYATQLLATGEQEIVERNYWHDRYWGRCTCDRCQGDGKNRLGQMLMKLREQLQGKEDAMSKTKPSVKDFVANKRRDEPFDVYVGRPTKWGNTFIVGKDGTHAEVVQKYHEYLKAHPELIEAARRELRGKTLGCWCKPLPCHAEVLAYYANGFDQEP